MFKQKLEQIKSLIVKEGDNKRKIENLVVFILILIITIIAINIIWKNDKKSSNTNKIEGATLAQQEENVQTLDKSELENKLENILNNIEGVGDVKVMVTYSQTSQTIAMYNEDNLQTNTEESDTQGGKRIISESNIKKEVIYKEVNGEKVPITQSIISPKVEGAIVAANGASDSQVKTNIIQAVEAVTGLATHKIQVFEMKK